MRRNPGVDSPVRLRGHGTVKAGERKINHALLPKRGSPGHEKRKNRRQFLPYRRGKGKRLKRRDHELGD